MNHHLLAGALLILGATVSAQGQAAQDPERPQENPAQTLEALTQERQRLEREIRYVQERGKGVRALLAQKLGHRGQNFRSIDAGTNAPKIAPGAPMAPRRVARIAGENELTSHGDHTLMVVNGRPISQQSFDALMQFLADTPNSGDESARTQRALFELIRIEGVASSFEEHDGEDTLSAIMGQLDAGKTIAELAPAIGVVQGSNPEGKMEIARNSIFGTVVEQVAFRTKPGERARPFRNAAGFVVMQVDSHQKGASPELDKVMATAIQVPYSGGPEALQKAQMAVSMGQADIAVRDEKVLAMLPAMFRQAPEPQPIRQEGPNIAAIEKGLLVLQQQMEKVQATKEPGWELRLQELQTQYDSLKAQIGQKVAPFRRVDEEEGEESKGKETPAKKEPVKKEPVKQG